MWICPTGGQAPLPTVGCTLHTPCQPHKGPTGMCSTGWELLVDEVAPSLPPLCTWELSCGSAIGTPVSRPAAGSHWRAFCDTSSLLLRPCARPPCLSQAQTLLWKFPRCLFLLYSHTGRGRGDWAADITSGEGSGQLVPVWAGMSLKHSGPSQATPMPPCIASLPRRACAAAQSSGARVEDFL